MNTSTWIFWIIVGVTILQVVFGKMREQAEVNRARKEREMRRQQALRTGEGLGRQDESMDRPTVQVQATQDLQARRQAQLRALRERQQQRMKQQQNRGPSRPTAGQRPAQTSTPQRSPARPAPPQTPAQTPAQKAARQRQMLIQREQQRRADEQRAEQEGRAAQRARQEAERTREKLRAQAAIKKQSLGTIEIQPADSVALAEGIPDVPRTRDDWRRAIIAAEILSRPVSVREGEF